MSTLSYCVISHLVRVVFEVSVPAFALAARGQAYADFMKRRARLIPFIW